MTHLLEEGGDERLHIWKNNEAIVMHRLNSEKVRPTDVVLLIDTTCDMGQAMVRVMYQRGTLTQDTIDGLDKIARSVTMIPTLCCLLERDVAISLAEINTPRIAEAIRSKQIPPGHIFAMVVAASGTLLLAPKRTNPGPAPAAQC